MSVNPRLIQTAGVPVIKEYYRILNGESWKANELLFRDGSGLLKVCASGAKHDTGGIKYLAMEDQDDPGNSTTTAPVVKLTRDMTLEMYASGTVSAANIGLRYALAVSSNKHTVNVSDTGNSAFEVVELGYERNPMEFTSADDPGVVWVKILTTVLEAAPA